MELSPWYQWSGDRGEGRDVCVDTSGWFCRRATMHASSWTGGAASPFLSLSDSSHAMMSHAASPAARSEATGERGRVKDTHTHGHRDRLR